MIENPIAKITPILTLPFLRCFGAGKLILSLLLMLFGILAANAQSQPTIGLVRFTFTEYHMGVDARLVVYAKDQNLAEKACSAAFRRIAELDSIMSDYRKESELMKLCRQSGGAAVPVSKDLFKVLAKAIRISSQTNGAFDVTAGPLIRLWRAARKSGKLPAANEISEAKKLVNWRYIRLDPKTQSVRLSKPGMQLDLGGIAKGYANDEAQKVLMTFGIKSALVEMGGDIVVTNAPPDAKGWKIRVPNAGKDQNGLDLYFTNKAISTSGDTEQFVIINNKMYSHVIDPRTGMAISNRVQSTVIANVGLDSDPLSTSMTLISKSMRARILRKYPGSKAYVKILKGVDPINTRDR